MSWDELKDKCTWRKCSHESSVIYYGVGLCTKHYSLAGATFKTPFEYAVTRVTKEAAARMRQTKESK